MCSAMCGLLNSRDRCSRLSPAPRAASAIVLTSPVTMASIAARTFFEMRRGLSGTSVEVSCGLSESVMFFMPATSAHGPLSQRTKRDVIEMAFAESRKPAGEPGR
jgi:hypothetical protein